MFKRATPRVKLLDKLVAGFSLIAFVPHAYPQTYPDLHVATRSRAREVPNFAARCGEVVARGGQNSRMTGDAIF
jgi:hypothetical protein